jgi:hypothetical protein
MKKALRLFSLIILLFFSAHLFSQTGPEVKTSGLDTMITKKNEKILGKITKVTETDLEYKKAQEADAPIYVISKDKLREIRWANGTREMVVADEMDANVEKEILNQRSAIKLHIFSPAASQLTVSYERCLKVGTNIEISLGLINNSLINNNSPNLIQGGLFSGGVKFLLGQDYYVKGLKYAHPLKGRYLKPEIDFSSFIIRGIRANYYNPNVYTYNSYIETNQQVNSFALMINYGRQFILGNILTFGYSVGLGYAASDAKYSNPYFQNNYGSYSNNPMNVPSDLYSHYLLSTNIPIAIKGTITMGYIFK